MSDEIQCQATRLGKYYNDTQQTDLQCQRRGRYEVSGEHYCQAHAEIALEAQLLARILEVLPQLSRKPLSAIIPGAADALPDRVIMAPPSPILRGACLACGDPQGHGGLQCPGLRVIGTDWRSGQVGGAEMTDTYRQDVIAAEEAVTPVITDELLRRVCALARVYGWGGELSEVIRFICWLHELRGLEFDDENFAAMGYGEPGFADELAALKELVKESGK